MAVTPTPTSTEPPARTYTFTTAAAENGNQYKAVFTNSIGSVTTNAATLTVHTPPTVTTNPTSVTVIPGQPASFTAAATGDPTPTVQWQVSTDGGNTFTNVAGATSDTYTLTTGAGDSGNQYQAVFTNSVSSVDTTAATLTLDTLPTVTTNPTSVTVITGQTASFSAAATGLPTPTVQWQVSTNGGSTFTNVGGATSDTYSLSTVLGDNGYQFRAVFTNVVGPATTTAATLTVNVQPPLTITTTTLPGGTVNTKSAPASYSTTLNATGGNPPYKWKVTAGSLPARPQAQGHHRHHRRKGFDSRQLHLHGEGARHQTGSSSEDPELGHTELHHLHRLLTSPRPDRIPSGSGRPGGPGSVGVATVLVCA